MVRAHPTVPAKTMVGFSRRWAHLLNVLCALALQLLRPHRQDTGKTSLDGRLQNCKLLSPLAKARLSAVC